VVKPCLFRARSDETDVKTFGAEAGDEVLVGLAPVEEDADRDAGAAARGQGPDEAVGREMEHRDVDRSGRGPELAADFGLEDALVAGGGEEDGDVVGPERDGKAEEEGGGEKDYFLSLFFSPRRTTLGLLNLAISPSFR